MSTISILIEPFFLIEPTSTFLIKFFPAYLQAQAKTLQAKHPLMGNKTTPSSQRDCPEQQDPHDWLQDRETFAPVSFYKPGSISSTLKTIFETLVHCPPGVGLSEISPFLISPTLVPLPLDFASGERPNLVCLGSPDTGALLYPSAQTTRLLFCFFFTLSKTK